MSDEADSPPEKPFSVEIAKQGKACCKKCKQKCLPGDLRVAKLIPNPFGSGKMKTWHHVDCIFEMFLKQRQTTVRIEGPQDVDGWETLSSNEKTNIMKKIEDCNKAFEAKLLSKSKKGKTGSQSSKAKVVVPPPPNVGSEESGREGVLKDNYFCQFRLILANISRARNSEQKIAIFRDIFSKGSDGDGFKGDLVLWCKLLLPAVMKRVFHVQTKQLVKIFSRIFDVEEDRIFKQLEENDVGKAIQHYFEQNKRCRPLQKSTLTIHEVDEFLETLTILTKEDDQLSHLKSFVKRCTGNDLKVVVRLITHDLRMNAGTKHVLKGVHPDAYEIFNKCRDIKKVINTCFSTPEPKKAPERRSKSPKKRTRRKSSASTDKTKKAKIDQLLEPDLDLIVDATKTADHDLRLDEDIMGLEEIAEGPPKTPEIIHEEAQVENQVGSVSERRMSVPNVFADVKLLLEEGVQERYAYWVRYFIAFGGAVLTDEERAQATHVLHLKDTVDKPTVLCASSARHMIVEWIKDSVEKQNLQDWRPYTVRWNPSHKE